MNNPAQALDANVSETAELSGVSDAIVVRFCKRIGYEGFYQMNARKIYDYSSYVAFSRDHCIAVNNSELSFATTQ